MIKFATIIIKSIMCTHQSMHKSAWLEKGLEQVAALSIFSKVVKSTASHDFIA